MALDFINLKDCIQGGWVNDPLVDRRELARLIYYHLRDKVLVGNYQDIKEAMDIAKAIYEADTSEDHVQKLRAATNNCYWWFNPIDSRLERWCNILLIGVSNL